MFEWLYSVLMSLVSFVLGLFGIEYGKKKVHFEDESEQKQQETSVDETPQTASAINATA